MHGIPIGRIAGFPVKVDWGVLVVLWLFTWSLASDAAQLPPQDSRHAPIGWPAPVAPPSCSHPCLPTSSPTRLWPDAPVFKFWT